MDDWLCLTCGASWQCEHAPIGEGLTPVEPWSIAYTKILPQASFGLNLHCVPDGNGGYVMNGGSVVTMGSDGTLSVSWIADS